MATTANRWPRPWSLFGRQMHNIATSFSGSAGLQVALEAPALGLAHTVAVQQRPVLMIAGAGSSLRTLAPDLLLTAFVFDLAERKTTRREGQSTWRA